MYNHRFKFTLVSCFLLLLIFIPISVHAGDYTLLTNSGSTSSAWFIDGEPTLVINGFDLTSLNLSYPVTLDVVTIAINQAVPDVPVQVVVYEDSNGGSPVDARLVSQTDVFIQTAGVARITLPNPAVINAPVVWVGFYLAPGFRFFADEQGTSVLTYWAWTPGTTFDPSNLGSAAILGPTDGTAPVSTDLGGVARITAEINSGIGTGVNESGIPVGTQIEGGSGEELAIMASYPYCGDRILFDPQDIAITAQAAFTIHCRADLGPFSPGTFYNADELPAPASEWERRGYLYEVFASGDYQTISGDSELLRVPVTHCLRPEQGELDAAVVGIGYGAPRRWEILPTQRYGEWVCAEVTHQGFISYFVPRAADAPTLNADLYFSGYPYLEGIRDNSDAKLICGYRYIVHYAVHNEGFEATPATNVLLQFQNVRTGTITAEQRYGLPSILPGETRTFEEGPFIAPSTYINELHSVSIKLDLDNHVAEANEDNNVFTRTGFFIVQRTGGC